MTDDYNFYDNAPSGYVLCQNGECASAGKCLRQLALRDCKEDFIKVVNPLRADTRGEGSCPFFRKAEKVRIAYGFKQAMARVESGRVAGARMMIIGTMSKRYYYNLLNGEYPLSTDIQQRIETVLRQYGVPAPIEFDRYEWRYQW